MEATCKVICTKPAFLHGATIVKLVNFHNDKLTLSVIAEQCKKKCLCKEQTIYRASAFSVATPNLNEGIQEFLSGTKRTFEESVYLSSLELCHS